MDRKVLVITGPCGVGKTSVAKLVAEKYATEYISGDEIKKRLFPEIAKITDYPEKLGTVKAELFGETKNRFNEGKNVVVDYVVVDQEQIEKYQNEFGDKLVIRILLPPVETTIKRDKERSCWMAGEEIIKNLHQKFEELKSILEPECFIDNSNESPIETVEKHFSII